MDRDALRREDAIKFAEVILGAEVTAAEPAEGTPLHHFRELIARKEAGEITQEELHGQLDRLMDLDG